MIGWDILFDGGAFDIDDVIADGKVIARYNETTNAKRAIRDAHEITFDNKRCIAINSNSHSSDILDAVAKPGVHVLRIIYSLNKDQKWYVSVYGEDKMVDCSEICKRNGGGGHRGAGGLLCEKLPWSQPC
jgi:nanoRNase/pAp phosphatase (c-di-AMP/oligoRNAs hydrolase)